MEEPAHEEITIHDLFDRIRQRNFLGIISRVNKISPTKLLTQIEGKSILHHAIWDECPLNAVECMVQRAPQLANLTDNRNRTPMHWAAGTKSTATLLYLLRISPQSIFLQDDYGKLPLHEALHANIDSQIIATFLEMHPQSIRIADKQGRLPLHIACSVHQSFDTIKLLLEKYPKALEITDDQQMMPLHACGRNMEQRRDQQIYKLIVERYPQAARIADGRGRLALHLALRTSTEMTWPVIEMLLQLFPDALHHRDDFGLLPVHLAAKTRGCRYEDWPHIRDSIFSQHLTETSGDGWTPLHYCAKHFDDTDLVIEVAKLDLRALTMGCRGILPVDLALKAPSIESEKRLKRVASLVETGPDIHYLCKDERTVVLLLTLDQFPSCEKVKDELGRLPLHIAALAGCHRMAGLLARVFKKGVEIRDKLGRLPLHYARDCHAVKKLLAHKPGSATSRDDKGLTPFQVASLMGADISCLYELLSASPDIVLSFR